MDQAALLQAQQDLLFWQQLLLQVLTLLGPIITLLLGWWFRKLIQRWEVNNQTALAKLFDELLAQGLASAEEWAQAAAKRGEPKPDSQAKQKYALEVVRASKHKKVANMADDILRKLLDAKLNQIRPAKWSGPDRLRAESK